MIDLLQDPLIHAMSKYMDRLSNRQQIVASNIANIDTPGYKTKDAPFHATMAELLAGSSVEDGIRRPDDSVVEGSNFTFMQPDVFEVRGLPMRPDQNNVDIDREMLNLGKTSGRFGLMAQLLRLKFRTLSNSINEGRIG